MVFLIAAIRDGIVTPISHTAFIVEILVPNAVSVIVIIISTCAPRLVTIGSMIVTACTPTKEINPTVIEL